MKRASVFAWLATAGILALLVGTTWARGIGGGFRGGGGGFRGGGGGFHGGGGFGGGGFHGGGGFPAGGGGFQGGGGLSGGGFRPSSAARPSISRPQTPSFNRPAEGLGGGGLNRPDVVHRAGAGGSGLQIGGRPKINPGGGITRPGLSPGSRPEIGGAGSRPNFPGIGEGSRPGNVSGVTDRFPGSGVRPGAEGAGTASLPGLGPAGGGTSGRLPFGTRPGAGGAGERFEPGTRPGQGGAGERFQPGTRPGQGGVRERITSNVRPGQGGAGERFPAATRPGQGGAGERFTPGNPNSIPDRHQDLANRFDDLSTHWNDPEWHHEQWTGPNGTDINHVGFWGPNGYWGHTGVWGPNGGHWGHSTGIGPNRAWTRTTGIGPNGAVWGHGAVVGPNGAFGYAGYAGPAGHWSRNWGGWYNGYAPAWGHGRWDYLWDEYPVAMAFGATMWGLNAVNWAFGVGSYYNPYYDAPVYVNNQAVVSYDQPIVGDPSYAAATSDAQAPAGEGEADSQSAPPDPLTSIFDQARQAFYSGQYDQALTLTDQALATAPRDAAINEFRSLCLFALGRYREAAATIHAVLAAGPGWDWTTMASLYPDQDVYTQQLRALEQYVKDHPQSADAEFLLAYHYITCGHKDAAVDMLKRVTQLQPQDQLAADLVKRGRFKTLEILNTLASELHTV